MYAPIEKLLKNIHQTQKSSKKGQNWIDWTLISGN